MRLVSLFTCFIVCYSSASMAYSASAILPERISKALQAFNVPESSVSIHIQALNHTTQSTPPVISLNASQPRSPASTIKVLSSYAALEFLGPSYSWKTDVFIQGNLNKKRLTGDLIIKGYGDPYLTTERLWLLILELRRKGIHHIQGNLIIDDSYFAPLLESPADFDNSPHRSYNLLPSAVQANWRAQRYVFNPLANGKVQIDAIPDLADVRIINELQVKKGRCQGYNRGIRIEVENTPSNNIVRFSGKHPSQCKDYQLNRIVLQNDSYFYALFKQLWESSGGTLSGKLITQTYHTKEPPFLRHYSPDLASVVRLTNKYSNNSMTRSLLLTLDAETNAPPAKTQRSIQTALNLLAQQGMNIENIVISNGSGLSRKTQISAEQLHWVLKQAYQSNYMPEFINSLPISGLDGTLRKRLTDDIMRGVAHLKTGRLDDVAALAGYVKTPSGQYYSLVFMINHPDAHRGFGKSIGDEIVKWLVVNYERELGK